MPRHLISLERLFNRLDAYIRRERGRKGGTSDVYEGMNIGSKFKPKMISISSIFSTKERTNMLFPTWITYYALTNMDHLLQIVPGSEMMFMLDGF